VPEAWLTKVVTNLCLDRLRSAQARRERAAGAWLPEPLLGRRPDARPGRHRRAARIGDPGRADPHGAPVTGRAGRLRPARGLLLQPRRDRRILDITESASQQHLHRARRRVAAERRRGGEVDPASARRIVEEFLAAATSGRTERLVALLTDDATAISDGAGLAKTAAAVQDPASGRRRVRAGFKPTPAKRRLAGGSPAIHIALVNGCPAILAVVDDRVVGAVAFDISDGKIASLRGIAAPDRLARLNKAWRRHEPDAPHVRRYGTGGVEASRDGGVGVPHPDPHPPRLGGAQAQGVRAVGMEMGVGEEFGGEQLRRGDELCEVVRGEDGSQGCAADARGAGIAREVKGVGQGRGYGDHRKSPITEGSWTIAQ
jgi:hypothetical protein